MKGRGRAGRGTVKQWKVAPFSEAFEVFIPILWFRFCVASLLLSLLFHSFLRFLFVGLLIKCVPNAVCGALAWLVLTPSSIPSLPLWVNCQL